MGFNLSLGSHHELYPEQDALQMFFSPTPQHHPVYIYLRRKYENWGSEMHSPVATSHSKQVIEPTPELRSSLPEPWCSHTALYFLWELTARRAPSRLKESQNWRGDSWRKCKQTWELVREGKPYLHRRKSAVKKVDQVASVVSFPKIKQQ